MNRKQNAMFIFAISLIIVGSFFIYKDIVNNSAIDKLSKFFTTNFFKNLFSILKYFPFSLGLSILYILTFRHNKSFKKSFKINARLTLFFILVVMISSYSLANMSVDTLNTISIIIVAIFGIAKVFDYIYGKINKE